MFLCDSWLFFAKKFCKKKKDLVSLVFFATSRATLSFFLAVVMMGDMGYRFGHGCLDYQVSKQEFALIPSEKRNTRIRNVFGTEAFASQKLSFLGLLLFMMLFVVICWTVEGTLSLLST